MEKENITYLGLLKEGLVSLLRTDGVFLIGEDVAETYGGAFRVSNGLGATFPEKVLNMPMSEQAFTGLGVGMALAGLQPIVEIMFGDFVTLIMDQLLNHASKFVGGFKKPLHLVVRAPMGGYRGYGATHSQSLEKIYLGLPYINIVMPSVLADPGELLKNSLMLGEPVLFIENKLDYTRKMFLSEKKSEIFIFVIHGEIFPIHEINIKNEFADIVILTYGGLVAPALTLINDIYREDEIAITLISITTLNGLDFEFLNKIIDNRSLYLLEEGHGTFGIGDSLLSNLYKNGFRGDATVIGAKMEIIGSSKEFEDDVLPNFIKIKENLLKKFS